MTATTIAALQERAYRQSAEKGFHDDEPTEGRALLSLNAERIALITSEASEALEELRNGKAPNETYYPAKPWFRRFWNWITRAPKTPVKPEGVPSEMADVVIRVLDFCGANNINLEAMILEKLDFNQSRPARHGGKKF